ncbi:AAA family ATPase [Gordonia sp. ABSL1-1]|uniref:ATP-binding protein n=1 Tax=Gordonia sp. ABSL1-1 TaxID=3053923 RepID=UPI00257418DD|nr:AAA family ATPase [Gordonia sp. ABSL1-1]MDL9936585.1 AAA family ATPase [Gordonia sp. ABSL1-1]
MSSTEVPGPAGPVLRAPAEQVYATELAALAAADAGARPPGWRLSPRAVRSFVVGDRSAGVVPKFYGDNALVERCIVTLMSNRGLLLAGEPGTAKSMLSELLSAAISGTSGQVVQGSTGTTEDKIAYSWNYALLLAEGPSQRALVRGPLYTAMETGTLCRFEEITRVQPEISDALIGVLSDKALHIPELPDDDAILFARNGFNVIATANLRDRGVHEMSSALKRRFNFETVTPIRDRALQAELITGQTAALLTEAGVGTRLGEDVVALLIDVFDDLRTGVTADGVAVERPAAVMSAAEAVAVGYAAALDAHYFGDGAVDGNHVARQLIGTVLKDNPDDATKLDQYFDVVVRRRAKRGNAWSAALAAHREHTA